MGAQSKQLLEQKRLAMESSWHPLASAGSRRTGWRAIGCPGLLPGVAGVLAAVLSACTGPGQRSSRAPAGDIQAEMLARVATVFKIGILYKPKPTPIETLASKLAPLIIQESAGPGDASRDNLFGAVHDAEVETQEPAVYALESEITLNGRTHTQVTFAWCYASGAPDSEGFQAVQITLNAAGEPVVWEPFSMLSKPHVLFVAESLEKAAAAEFGAPLAGRRYAVESSRDRAPGVMVGRLIDDGPVPMGPMVYVQRQTHQVTTILCRCMPAQTTSVAATAEYALLSMEALDAAVSPRLAKFIRGSGHVSRLRLPSDF
jgi:hypothetical protein